MLGNLPQAKQKRFIDTHVPDTIAAEIIGSNPSTVRRWRFEKRGPRYRKVAGKVFYAIADLETYLSERIVETRDTLKTEAG